MAFATFSFSLPTRSRLFPLSIGAGISYLIGATLAEPLGWAALAVTVIGIIGAWFFKSRNRQTFSYFFSIFSIFKRYLIKQKPPKTVDFQQFREVSFYILNNNILLIIIYRYFCAFFTHYCILSGYLKLLFIREIIKSITPRLNHTFRWGFNKAIESVNIIICWCGKSYCSYCPKNCINYIMD